MSSTRASARPKLIDRKPLQYNIYHHSPGTTRRISSWVTQNEPTWHEETTELERKKTRDVAMEVPDSKSSISCPALPASEHDIFYAEMEPCADVITDGASSGQYSSYTEFPDEHFDEQVGHRINHNIIFPDDEEGDDLNEHSEEEEFSHEDSEDEDYVNNVDVYRNMIPDYVDTSNPKSHFELLKPHPESVKHHESIADEYCESHDMIVSGKDYFEEEIDSFDYSLLENGTTHMDYQEGVEHPPGLLKHCDLRRHMNHPAVVKKTRVAPSFMRHPVYEESASPHLNEYLNDYDDEDDVDEDQNYSETDSLSDEELQSECYRYVQKPLVSGEKFPVGRQPFMRLVKIKKLDPQLQSAPFTINRANCPVDPSLDEIDGGGGHKETPQAVVSLTWSNRKSGSDLCYSTANKSASGTSVTFTKPSRSLPTSSLQLSSSLTSPNISTSLTIHSLANQQFIPSTNTSNISQNPVRSHLVYSGDLRRFHFRKQVPRLSLCNAHPVGDHQRPRTPSFRARLPCSNTPHVSQQHLQTGNLSSDSRQPYPLPTRPSTMAARPLNRNRPDYHGMTARPIQRVIMKPGTLYANHPMRCTQKSPAFSPRHTATRQRCPRVLALDTPVHKQDLSLQTHHSGKVGNIRTHVSESLSEDEISPSTHPNDLHPSEYSVRPPDTPRPINKATRFKSELSLNNQSEVWSDAWTVKQSSPQQPSSSTTTVSSSFSPIMHSDVNSTATKGPESRLCCYCGCQSVDLSSCDNCHQLIPPTVKRIKTTPQTTNPQYQVGQPCKNNYKQLYASKINSQLASYRQAEGMNKCIPVSCGNNVKYLLNRKPQGRPKGSKNKKKLPPETVTISSDEDNDDADRGDESLLTFIGNQTGTPVIPSEHKDQLISRNTPNYLETEQISNKVTANANVSRRRKMENMKGELPKEKTKKPKSAVHYSFYEDEGDLGVALDCQDMYIGSLRCTPVIHIIFRPEFISCDIECVMGTSKVFIEAKDIKHIRFCMSCQPWYLIISTTPAFGIRIRQQFNMRLDSNHGYFDPASCDMVHQFVLLLLNGDSQYDASTLKEILLKMNTSEDFTREVGRMEILQILDQLRISGNMDDESDEDISDQQALESYYSLPSEGMDSFATISSQETNENEKEMDNNNKDLCHPHHPSPDQGFPDTGELLSFSGPVINLFTYPPPPEKGGIHVTTEDVFCLTEGVFLNDVIIDFYLKYIYFSKLSKEIRDKTHIFNSFFYKSLSQRVSKSSGNLDLKQKRHNHVKTWTRHVDLFSKDFIVIPINEHSHWFLAVICFPELVLKSQTELPTTSSSQSDVPNPEPPVSTNQVKRKSNKKEDVKKACILIFDSLAGPPRTPIIRMLRDYLQVEWNMKRMEECRFNKDTIKGGSPKVPQQNNFSDCGVFVLQYAESFFETPIINYNLPMRGLENWFDPEVVYKKREHVKAIIMELNDRYSNKPKS